MTSAIEKPLTVKFPHVPGRFGGYGRNINHDPRSRMYGVGKTASPTTKRWDHRIAILDQGQLGSCTGNATVGCLGTDPFYGTLSEAQQKSLDEKLAVAIYSGGTKRDSDPQNYPPVDTGSDGVSVAAEAQSRGLISGYQHIFSIGNAYAAILDGPFIAGTNFYASMEEPDKDGLVVVKGQLLGGHEYVCVGYDADTDRWEFINSWGDSWGVGGHFYMSTASFTRLLREQGDATPFVPLTKPAPTPTPTPAPSNGVDPVAAYNSFPFATFDNWEQHPRFYSKPRKEYAQWKQQNGIV